MKPRCDPISDTATYFENQQACHDAAVKIVERLEPVIEMRHKIGEARLTSKGRKTIPVLEKGLSEAAKPILDTYSREEGNCEKTDDVQSCIYAEQFRLFMKFFGPVVPVFAGTEHSPVSIEMAHLKSGYLIAPVEPKRSGYEALLDTGAGGTILSVEISDIFKDGIRILTQNAEYGEGAPIVTIKGMTFNLGGVKFEPTLGLVSPVVDFFEGSDERHKLVAILGADFLFHRSWEVDYDSSSLILEQDVEKELLKDNRWSQVPLFPTVAGSLSYYMGIDISINGKTFQLLLDTGVDNTSLLEQCSLPNAKSSGRSFAVTIEGLHERREFEGVHIKLGKYESSADINVSSESSVNAKALYKEGLCGLLGNDVLDRYNYMFDPKTFSLYIRPRDEKGIPRFRRIGFVPNRTKQEGGQAAFVITEIIPETPAEKAGLKPGDIIIEIDGMKSGSTSMLELMEISYQSKPEVQVSIIRNGETKKLTLKFKK